MLTAPKLAGAVQTPASPTQPKPVYRKKPKAPVAKAARPTAAARRRDELYRWMATLPTKDRSTIAGEDIKEFEKRLHQAYKDGRPHDELKRIVLLSRIMSKRPQGREQFNKFRLRYYPDLKAAQRQVFESYEIMMTYEELAEYLHSQHKKKMSPAHLRRLMIEIDVDVFVADRLPTYSPASMQKPFNVQSDFIRREYMLHVPPSKLKEILAGKTD